MRFFALVVMCVACACLETKAPKAPAAVAPSEEGDSDLSGHDMGGGETGGATYGGAVASAPAPRRGKQKIAILGIETVVTGKKADPEDVRVARDLTVEIRKRSRAGTGPFELAPDSDRELLDERLVASCEIEDTDCMRKIAARIGASALVYGKLERKSLAGGPGFQVMLWRLGPDTASSTWTDFVPLAEASGASLSARAKKGYGKLTGVAVGTLRVTLGMRIEGTATVLLDGEQRGTIVGDTVEIPDLAAGPYTLSVVASGYERFDSERKISIIEGEVAKISLFLKKLRP